MSKKTYSENEIKNYYDTLGSKDIEPELVKELIYGFHFPYYKKRTDTWKDACLNTNDLISNKLALDTESLEVLDAGCGMGGTLVYLAKKYPNIHFTGVTISPNEINLAKKLKNVYNVDNIEFLVGNYADIDVDDKYFDGVFALDSMCYSEDKHDFVNEMRRVLKSNGRFFVLDGFRSKKPLGFFTEKIYKSYLKNLSLNDLMSINDFLILLQTAGFKDIKTENLIKKPLTNFLKNANALSGESYIISNYNKDNKRKLFQNEQIHMFLLELSKKMNCYSVSCVKN